MDDEKSQHLVARRSLLLLIDFQARLMPVLNGGTEAINSAIWLGGIAQALEIPVWLTEHCPDKLGASAPMTHLLSERTRCFTKRSFSALEEPAFRHALESSGCDQLVVCGAEAHVCVMQTVLSLCSAGYRVALVADGVASRRPREAALGVARCEAAGASIVSAEMVAYEWLGCADHVLFGDIHRRYFKPRAAEHLTFPGLGG
ncbi:MULTISPECIES: isochorismatase family protein [unclassified Cobetia]|uniref:isochorismatase family protein n=1 Tax=unclassified Cobetia TaxID=2609414 RepID=UPI00159D4171|nr:MULTISPECIES: isochorismatase family protein [unclassified Cobetia]MCO7234070.1 isochorismatase family protein [Cobetia sp. Dlab-2-AX]MCO7237304.1 isochorismatase family protein [Cobetia sp. Dlab-2-U]NVN57319.1 isochorismatase family protein [bacterium Scap17]